MVLVSGDVHNGWLNSRALSLLGVPPREGALDENEWFAVLGRLAELPGDERAMLGGYRAAVRDASAKGVVGIVDFELAPGWREWPARYDAGVTGLRVRAATYPDRLGEVVAAGLRTGDGLSEATDLLTMGPLKVIADGSLNTGTAFCHAPYTALGGPASRGTLNLSPAELTGLMREAAARGLECAIHAIGDAANGIVLDAFEATGARGSVEHAQLMSPSDVRRMGRLGVRASVQPAHLLDDREVAARLWGDRLDECFPLGSLAAAGVPLAFGSDAPVAPLDPWLAMAAAVHRSADDREPWNPPEHLTAAHALAASTDGRGTLRVGARADVVLLDRDPLADVGDPIDTAAVAAHLRTMPVAATFVADARTRNGTRS